MGNPLVNFVQSLSEGEEKHTPSERRRNLWDDVIEIDSFIEIPPCNSEA